MIKRIDLEGHDLCGKSTQFKEIWKNLQDKNNYELILSDRGYFSVLCYGIYYNRSKFDKFLKNFLIELNNNLIVFYIKISENSLIDRFNKRNDELRKLDEIIEIKKIYDNQADFFENHHNFYIINGEKSIDEISEEIINILNRDKNKQWHKKLFELDNLIDCFGKRINNTIEVENFEMHFSLSLKDISIISLSDIERTLSCNVKNDFFQLEIDSYKNQICEFNRKIESILSGYYCRKEDFTSRKFIFVDHECLSLVHILFRDEISVNVYFRSSNIAILECDILSVMIMVKNFLDKIKKYNNNLFLDTSMDYILNNIKLNLYFCSLHKIIKNDK